MFRYVSLVKLVKRESTVLYLVKLFCIFKITLKRTTYLIQVTQRDFQVGISDCYSRNRPQIFVVIDKQIAGLTA